MSDGIIMFIGTITAVTIMACFCIKYTSDIAAKALEGTGKDPGGMPFLIPNIGGADMLNRQPKGEVLADENGGHGNYA